ncbi:MAG: hypothetical protein JWM93_497 [Frankiales bacterium]|nr:hypothetical protein [Frankiales bacterium]
MQQAKQTIQYVETRIRQSLGNERGDVPGWVMITLMTCAIAAILWGLAGDWLRSLFDSAKDQVTTVKDRNPGSTGG